MSLAELDCLSDARRATSTSEAPRVLIEQAMREEDDAAAPSIVKTLNPLANAHRGTIARIYRYWRDGTG